MVNTTASKPDILLTNKADDATGPIIFFINQRVDSSTQAGEDNDFLGQIYFRGYNDGTPALKTYGTIAGKIGDATTGQEAGDMYFKVAAYDGVLETGLYLDGDTNADGEVDVTIAAGAASVTTVAGTLTMGSTAALTNAGLVAVANQSNITGLGTISSGIWNGNVIGNAYLDPDTAHLTTDQTFTGVKTFDQAINKKALFYMQTQNRFTNTTADEYYFSLIDVERDVAKGSEAGLGVVAMIPCDGILKQVILNTSSNISGQSWEWKIYRVPSGTVATSEILIATVASNAGPTSNTNKVISFVANTADTNVLSFEGGYDATTMFTAGDRVLFSQESNADASGSPKINIIMCFELDESTI